MRVLRAARALALASAYVAGSSVLGLLPLIVLGGGPHPARRPLPWEVVAGFWAESVVADVLFAGGSVAIGVAAHALAVRGRRALSPLVAGLATAVLYAACFSLASSGGGLAILPAVPLLGALGIAFAAGAPVAWVERSERRTRRRAAANQ